MNYNYLIDHALKNVWCTPHQDMQSITQLAKIVPVGGVFNYVRVGWSDITLPLLKTRFFVYQIGQLHPSLMGLFPVQYQWVKMSDACNQMKLIVDLYANTGVQLPRTESWYMVTADRDLIVAIQEQPKIPINMDTDLVFFRVYTNAFFQLPQTNAGSTQNYVLVNGGTPLNQQAIIDLQMQYNQLASQPGKVYAFVNGYAVSQIDLFTVAVGDIVEFVYDSSVYKVVDFPVSGLQTFVSQLDTLRKYLLHYAGLGDSEIDYQDDIDVFLLYPQASNRFKGVYFHRNNENAMRMVTHKDYAIPTAYVAAYSQDNTTDFPDPNQFTVRLHIRKGGWDRQLVNENNRIKELYKLDDDDLKGAMLGVNSNVTNWRADTLENAAYPAIMRNDGTSVTAQLVQDAYGYNAISKLVADTPQFPYLSSNQPIVTLPYGLTTSSTVYEYDVNGLYLGWHTHLSGTTYPISDARCKLVEAVNMLSGNLLDEVFGAKTTTLATNASYRMYICPQTNGVPDETQWQDVTGSSKYGITNGVLTWAIDQTKWLTCVRSDLVAYQQSTQIQMVDGLLQLTVIARQNRPGGIGNYVMNIPQGELDIMVNGHACVENVDYYVKWPHIYITNKEFLLQPVSGGALPFQTVLVRSFGFCLSDLTREPLQDVGYVQYGMLSRNNRYDIRDDRVLRITAGGRVFDRSQLQFAENDPNVYIGQVPNGSPYQIRDLVVPMRGLTPGDTYVLRSASQQIDVLISAYMTEKMPQPPITNPDPVTALWRVVSPFVCKLINDCLSGVIPIAQFQVHYNDMYVQQVCAPYLYLLDYDPTQDKNFPDPRFTIIHPHNLLTVVQLNIYYYKFIQKAVDLYCNGRVKLNDSVSLTAF